MISGRYAPALCVLLALALVPTLLHSYAGVVVTDRLTTNSIPQSLAGFEMSAPNRDAAWGSRQFDSTDWFERKYSSRNDEALLTIARSYDLKRLYHHPELGVAHGVGFLRFETHRFSAHPSIPVHVLYADEEGGSIAMYALHYDGEFVDNPLRFQLRTAASLLFSGRKPMTLFFVRDLSAPNNANPETLPAADLLFAAIDRFTHPGEGTTTAAER